MAQSLDVASARLRSRVDEPRCLLRQRLFIVTAVFTVLVILTSPSPTGAQDGEPAEVKAPEVKIEIFLPDKSFERGEEGTLVMAVTNASSLSLTSVTVVAVPGSFDIIQLAELPNGKSSAEELSSQDTSDERVLDISAFQTLPLKLTIKARDD